MEYEFSQDMLGGPVARFSMGHEAFGFWLEDEIDRSEASEPVLTAVERIQQGRAWEWGLAGREYGLQLAVDEAVVSANVLGLSADSLDDDALSLSEEGQLAACGLEDFLEMMVEWKRFLESIRR